MNLILLFPEDFSKNESHVRLRGRRLEHVLSVHRASIGDELCVGKMDGNVGTGKIVELNHLVLEMEVQFDQQPPPALPLQLVLALPRPKVLKRVLQCVSALGVKHITLLNSVRVEKSYWQSPLLKMDALREALTLGLEQAKDTVLPEILLRPLFKPFVEDELPSHITGTRAIVSHPAAVAACPRDVKTPVTLAVGPEGGFIPYEVEKLIHCGFQAVCIGDRILNVETAIPALISRLF